ncbi:MAG: phenylacetic acid degradation operon negative regulatory protein [Parcubacteria group bacterium Gr01-1014_17]|nr:MAG: phenylacetic acid degradation operon negative regulatory protein [Parcubacteria group bacterium Gr01-1014_17]
MKKRKNEKEWLTKRKKVGAMQQKILLLLLGGVALACARTVGEQWKILTEMGKEWKHIKRQRVERAIAALYESRLVDMRRSDDGTFTLVLNEDGKKRALSYNLGNMHIAQPETWDEIWRVVLFDIPEEKRSARDALRTHLLNLGFFELQRSVLVHPFECRDEIDFLIELNEVRPYVRFMRAHHIDNEPHLKRFFRLHT